MYLLSPKDIFSKIKVSERYLQTVFNIQVEFQNNNNKMRMMTHYYYIRGDSGSQADNGGVLVTLIIMSSASLPCRDHFDHAAHSSQPSS
jgi:hypothetical protein